MEIKRELLQKLSQLAALRLDDKEQEMLIKDLQAVLSHFQEIKDVPTKGLAPLVSPLPFSVRLRKDEKKDFSSQEALLEGAPEKQGSLFKVPPVV